MLCVSSAYKWVVTTAVLSNVRVSRSPHLGLLNASLNFGRILAIPWGCDKYHIICYILLFNSVKPLYVITHDTHHVLKKNSLSLKLCHNIRFEFTDAAMNIDASKKF